VLPWSVSSESKRGPDSEISWRSHPLTTSKGPERGPEASCRESSRQRSSAPKAAREHRFFRYLTGAWVGGSGCGADEPGAKPPPAASHGGPQGRAPQG